MAVTKSRSQVKKDTVENASTQQVIQEATVATELKRTNTMSDQSSILEFSEDISTAEAPVPLPEGDYTAEIRAAVRKTSPTTGNDYVAVTFYIPSEQYPADYTDGDPDGMTFNYNRVSMADTVPGRYRLKKFIDSIGAKGGKSIDLNDWVGLTATVHVKVGTWEGEPRNEIDKVVSA